MGNITASFKASLAASKPATSSHFTFGFSDTIAEDKAPRSLDVSSSSPFASLPLLAVAPAPPAPPPPTEYGSDSNVYCKKAALKRITFRGI